MAKKVKILGASPEDLYWEQTGCDEHLQKGISLEIGMVPVRQTLDPCHTLISDLRIRAWRRMREDFSAVIWTGNDFVTVMGLFNKAVAQSFDRRRGS